VSFSNAKKEVLLLEDQVTAVAVLNEQVCSLRNRVDAMEISIDTKFTRIENKLDEAIKGRPSWSIVLILSGLLTVSTGLTVFILTVGVR